MRSLRALAFKPTKITLSKSTVPHSTKSLTCKCQLRQISTTAVNYEAPSASSSDSKGEPMRPNFGGGTGGTMKSWQIHNYGGPSELQLSSVRIPPLNNPEEVLIKVHAASVNPIDLAMSNGYGADTINVLRDLCPSTSLSSIMEAPQKLAGYLMTPVAGKKTVIEFPLTLGRDFAGVVTQVGHGLKTDVRVGDEVYGVVGVQRQGSHAEYVVVSEDTIRKKPKNLTFVEAASIPYVGLTAWSAIRVTGTFLNLAQKRFLVLGGSGGVGTFAIQYLKAEAAHVTASCSTDALPLVISLGADNAVDYKDPDSQNQIKNFAPYDCILHLSGPENVEKSMEFTKYLKPVSGQFITLSPPFLANVDRYGLLGGAARNISDLLLSNIRSWTDAKAVTKWAFFIPRGEPLRQFADLIEKERIKPVVQSVHKFDQLPDAYGALEKGHLRGKVVVDFQS